MPLPSKLDALIVLLTAAVGMAMVEDRNRTEITLPRPSQISNPVTLEACAEQAEYRRRAMRVTVLLTGGMPDADWLVHAKPASAACGDKPASIDPAGHDRPRPE
jgi:hypothetical protein